MNERANQNLEQLVAVAAILEPLLSRLVLVGGCATSLLVTDPGAPDARPTTDVDMIVDVLTITDYQKLEQEVRDLGFQPDAESNVICRWTNGKYIVDIMPDDAAILGFSNRWYGAAIESAESLLLRNKLEIRHVNAPYFLATKLEAFFGRGEEDYVASHDLEDLLALVDGRASLLAEVKEIDKKARAFIAESMATLMAVPEFMDALPGHLPGDVASQQRLPKVQEMIRRIADLSN